jgi:hypothetical protein
VSLAYERRHQPLAPVAVFRRRVARHVLFALLGIVVSLAVGTLGYHTFGGEAWIDAFVNASMLLGGMGEVGEVSSVGGKLFSALFALYAGLFFIAVSGVLLAPFLHRVMHRFHLDK